MNLREIQRIEVEDSPHYFPDHNSNGLEYLGVALAGEVGEVCNEIKKWSRGDFVWQVLRERLGGELPDILIYLVMLAGAMEIDLQDAWEQKKEYNDRRYRGLDN